MLDLFAVFQSVYLKKKDRAWDVKRETRKAVAAGSLKELDHLQEGLNGGLPLTVDG